MRDHGTLGFGVQHAIEFEIIRVDGLTCDLFDRLRAQVRVTNDFVCMNRIRDVRWLADRFSRAQSLRCGQDSILDGGIARAAAERILECETNLISRRIRIALEQRVSGHNLTRDAKSALHRAMFNKSFLKRMKFHLCVDTLGKPLDGDDGFPIGALSGIDTGHDRLAIHKHSTRSALSLIASDFRTC